MKRAFDSVLEFKEDAREVFGRIFPFHQRARVREMENGQLVDYTEEFLPGCTQRMRQVAQRRGGGPTWISFTIDHDSAFDSRLGFCTNMNEEDDGAYGTFRLYDGPHLPKVRSMLMESHKGLSVEFSDVATPVISNGGALRQRRQINVAHVTATPIPIYEAAGILAMRDGDAMDMGTPNLDAALALLAEFRPQPVDAA